MRAHISRRPKTVAASIMVSVLAVAGVAIAAVMLSTSFTGHANAVTKHASDQVTSVKVSNMDNLQCQGSANGDGESFTLNTTATTLAGDQDSTLAGSCDVTVVLKNTGDVDLWVTGATVNLPDGWTYTVSDVDGAGSVIHPGDSINPTVKIKSANDATTGDISGQLNVSTEQP